MIIKSVWYCKVGKLGQKELLEGCDFPMRQAIKNAYYQITGEWPDFCFSGWNTDMTKTELEIINDK